MSRSRRRRVPKYCHHKARNLARVTIDGQDHYLGKYNSPESKQQYRELIGQWLDRQQEEIQEVAADIRICELMVAYMRHCSEYYRKGGKITRENGCITEALRIVRKHFDLETVESFGPKALKTARASMVESGWSRKYINKQIGRVVRMFRWGVGEQLVRPTVWHALQAVEGLKKGRTKAPDYAPIEPVCNEVVEATLPYLSGIVKDMVRVQRLTGCRPGEVCLLRSKDIDQSDDIWRFVPTVHKTEHQEKIRVIWIGPQAQRILQKYLMRPETDYCFDPREAPNVRRNAGTAIASKC